ncbi:hypothetical protein L3X07_10635 [Levilactobacillus brevis]|nr:hypothetical protein [Levilactobacillus brevis]
MGTDGLSDDDLRPTPRAWERVSRAITELQRQELLQNAAITAAIMQGNLGMAVGTTFASYLAASPGSDSHSGVHASRCGHDANRVTSGSTTALRCSGNARQIQIGP